MKMLCVGGACDGETVEAKQGDRIMVATFESTDTVQFGMGGKEDRQTRQLYQPQSIRVGRDEVWLLVPLEQTAIQTFSLLLAGYRQERK